MKCCKLLFNFGCKCFKSKARKKIAECNEQYLVLVVILLNTPQGSPEGAEAYYLYRREADTGCLDTVSLR